MNLFNLFINGALDHLKEETDSRTVSTDLLARLQEEHQALSSGYADAEPINYQTLERRLAYAMFYAPKHAYVWREYGRQEWNDRQVLRLNSFGTGPGSEIIGLAEHLRPGGLRRVEAVCLEREDSWRNLAHRVFQRYQEETGVEMNVLWVTDSSYFRRNQHLVGSFVLSELARESLLSQFRAEMVKRIGPARGTFIDGTAVNVVTGKCLLSSMAGQNWYDHFGARGWLCKDDINTAWSACNVKVCGHVLPAEPNICAFKYNFR